MIQSYCYSFLLESPLIVSKKKRGTYHEKNSKGKFEKLQKPPNDQDVIAALTIDQRGSMVKMMKEAVGEDRFSMDQVYEFKELVLQELAK